MKLPQQVRPALVVFGIFLGMLLLPCAMSAEPIKVVRHHTQEWRGVTNRDGTGLYHDIMRAIFGARGIEIVVVYEPFRRSVAETEQGKADIAGGTTETGNFLCAGTRSGFPGPAPFSASNIWTHGTGWTPSRPNSSMW